MTLDLSVNGFRGFNIVASKSRESTNFHHKCIKKQLQGPENGSTEIYKPSLDHFYALKPSVIAHRNAPKIVCKFQLVHLLASEAIFGGSITEIRDSLYFEGKMLKPRKPLTERSRVIFFFKWSQMDQILIPHRPLIRIGPKSLISKVIHLADDCTPPRTFV